MFVLKTTQISFTISNTSSFGKRVDFASHTKSGLLYKGGRQLVMTACLSWWLVVSSCQSQYVKWRPMDVVARLMVAKIDPADAYHALEAVKTKPVAGALQAVKDLQLDIENLYNVLRDMRIDPQDAFFALKVWVREHSEEDKKDNSTNTEFLDEIQSLLNKIVKAFQESSFRNLAEDAKELAATVNDPEKLFQDFFGYDKTFQAFKRLHPAAFETVRNILFGRSSPSPQVAQTVTHAQQVQQPNEPPRATQPPQQNQPPQVQNIHQHIQSIHPQTIPNDPDLIDPQFADTDRYNRILDETHVYHKGPQDLPNTPRQTVHNIRRYYDKQNSVVVESLKTIEYHDSGLKSIRKNVRTLNNNTPNTK